MWGVQMTFKGSSLGMDQNRSAIHMDKDIGFRSLPLGLRKLLNASNHFLRRMASLFRRYSISSFSSSFSLAKSFDSGAGAEGLFES